MPWDDIDNTASSASLRLGKLTSAPLASDLDFALAQAKKNTSAVVELPWKSHQSRPTFVLKVSCLEGEADANWVLYQGDSADANVLWSFDSDDTTLIESLIAAECGSDRSFAASQAVREASNAGYETGPGGSPSASVPGAPAATRSQSPQASLTTATPPAQPRGSQIALPPPVELDRALLEEIDRHLKDPDTGIITRAGFLFFMTREYARYQSLGAPMAVLIFELQADYGNDKIMPLPDRALKEAFARFGTVMNGVDILAHYNQRQFAFIKPGVSANDAIQFAQRVEKVLLEGPPLQPGLVASQVIFCAGVAGIPDTCDHPGVVLAACQKALAQAKERKPSLALFPGATAR